METIAESGTEAAGLLKNNSTWLKEETAPQHCLEIDFKDSEETQAILTTYNRLGALMGKLAARYDIKLAVLIAIWVLESGWRPIRYSRLTIYFQVNEFFNFWGKRWRQSFDLHFRFGGHNLQPGQPWENHEYRPGNMGSFASVHHNQNSEYEALTLARMLAGDEAAFYCLTAGGPLLPVSDYRLMGYESAAELVKAFRMNEATHVLSFFDLCCFKQAPKSGQLLQYLRMEDFANFYKYYKYVADADRFVERLKMTIHHAEEVLLRVRP